MHLPDVKYYYEQIRLGSCFVDYLNNAWNTILPMYFSAEKGYAIETYQPNSLGLTRYIRITLFGVSGRNSL